MLFPLRRGRLVFGLVELFQKVEQAIGNGLVLDGPEKCAKTSADV
jgi:hypothetical protein